MTMRIENLKCLLIFKLNNMTLKYIKEYGTPHSHNSCLYYIGTDNHTFFIS